MLSITCFVVQDLHLYSNHSPSVKIDPEPTEMTDFRSQLNQALKARRESAAEEQKLLSESSTQTSHMHGQENGNRRASFIEELKLKSSDNENKNVPKNMVLQKPLIPPTKPPVLINNGIKTPPSSPSNSTAPPSPSRVEGTTIKNEGFLTTLL